MAYKISIPFYTFRLHFSPNLKFLNPLRDKDSLRTGIHLKNLAEQYQSAIQKKMLNQGEALKLLNEWSSEDFIKDEVSVQFPAAKDGVTYPAFELAFDMYFQELATGFWGVVPSLGVEAFANDHPQLLKNLVETIKIEFARNGSLGAVQNIISTIWFESTELLREDIALKVADPGEDLTKKEAEKNTKLLRKVARELKIKKQEVYGRDKELDQIEQILKSNFSRNILLVGPSGVGKTALVWELAQQMKKRDIPGSIWETTASNMIKELSGDNGWEFNISEMCRELQRVDHHFLFIRNLMDLFEVGKYVGNSVSMADYLLPFISKGEINVIAECTDEELARIELQSPTYTMNFQVIRLEEPKDDLEGIILKKMAQIAHNNKVRIVPDAIKEVIRLIRRFTPYAGMPGRPIRFLESIMLNKAQENQKEEIIIGRTEVIEYFCEDTGMPMFMVDPSIPMNPERIKTSFNNSVFGQELAVESLVDIMATVKAALTRSGKPIASFLFVGPTGVGKTELAKVLASFMFGRRNRMLRFDMSEYSNPYSVMRLIGQDTTSEGQLTAAVRREPFSVILFDEIEKADPSFFDLLLQVLSEGRLTDNRGNLANFCSTIIIMTSNIGATTRLMNPIGLGRQNLEEDIIDHFESAVRNHFRPELYNRIDKIIPFRPLDEDTVRFVVDRELQLMRSLEGIKFRKLDLELQAEVYDFLARKGFNSQYGARYLQRTIRERLLNPLAQQLNQSDFDDQIMLKVEVIDDDIQVTAHADPLALELLLEELNKIQNADFASSNRRHAAQFLEGYHFTMLLQELDKLEEKKKRTKEAFWRNKMDAEKLGDILNLKKRAEERNIEINTIENELSLMALGMKPYRTNLIEDLEQWEVDLLDLKTDIYAFLFPNQNSCHFTLYGKKPEKVFSLYLHLLEQKEFDISVQTVWCQEDKDVKGDQAVKSYIKEPLINFKKFKEEGIIDSPGKGFLLLGFEVVLLGRAVGVYLKGESLVQKWYDEEEKEDLRYIVSVNDHPEKTPNTLHRKDFLKRANISRSYNGKHFKDNNWGLNRELSWNQLKELFSSKLEEDFKMRISLEMGI